MAKKHEKNANKSSMSANPSREPKHADGDSANRGDEENPPRTTSRSWLTTPKFGSSTSGGGEVEPGPERD